MIIYSDWITREDLRANPDHRFVFGDNVEREGFGGQAAFMRGEPNAIGVATKRRPGMRDEDFFTDSALDHSIVEVDLAKVRAAHDAGLTVVVPSAGLGTGLSQLPQRAPGLHARIRLFFIEHAGHCPWE